MSAWSGDRYRRLGLVIALALLAPAASASASTITVNTTADQAPSASDCAFRDAIAAASQNLAVNGCPAGDSTGTDLIQFAPGVTGTISLQSALPNVSGTVEIDGPGAGQLDLHRADGAPAFRILTVGGAAVVTVSGLTVSNGLAQGVAGAQSVQAFGGGIRNMGGTLTLDRVTVKDNRAVASVSSDNAFQRTAQASGGGIASAGGSANGSLTIIRSKVTGNSASAMAVAPDDVTEASAAAVGGGIFASNLSITIDRSTVSGNEAAGSTTSGESDVGTRAVGVGGGFYAGRAAFADQAAVTVDRSTISSNTAGFSHSEGDYALSGDGALGGGLYIEPVHDITVTGATVTGNSAATGGGAYFDGGDVISVVASTLASNSAATAANLADPTLNPELNSTVIADPLGGGVNCDVAIDHSTDSFGNNLEGPNPGASAPSCALTEPTDQTNVDPHLAPLADNGGPTETMALSPTSPAVDMGTSSGATTDQRGEPRPADLSSVANGPGSDGADVGAFELQEAEIDIAEPNTAITAGPADGSTITDPTPSFSFTGTDDRTSVAELGFECKVDGGSFTSCSSPKQLGLLADGPHSFQVRAIDKSQNIDSTPAVRSFTVKTAAISRSGSTLIVIAAPGAKDNLKVTAPVAGKLVVSDAPSGAYTGSGVHAVSGSGCARTSDYAASCNASGVRAIQVSSGDMTDTIRNATALPAALNGAAANDALIGGVGNDTLTGGPGADTFKGMEGNDTLSARDLTTDTLISCDGGTKPGSADKAVLDRLPKDPNSIVSGCETKARP